MTDTADTVQIAARVVAAYVSNNRILAEDLPGFVETVHRTIIGLGNGPQAVVEAAKPAVSIRRSVTGDHIVCLEDGLKFKSLKRHLWSSYGLTPEQYRVKWGLPHDYPMVAPNYAARRSALAKQIGRGRKRGRRR
ncbi:MAG: MucR family transcriptional regulator [Micropepsaceae bacterium]